MTNNQKIGIGIGGVILIGVGGWYFMQKRKANSFSIIDEKKDASAKPELKVEQPKTQASYSYNSQGNLTDSQKEYELYKSLIGMGSYVMCSTDSNSIRLRKQVDKLAHEKGITKDKALYEVLKNMKAGDKHLKGALKLIGGDIKSHVEYFHKHRKFKV